MGKRKGLTLQHKSDIVGPIQPDSEENTCYRPLKGSSYKSKPTKIEP